jgi:hypothetical protein
MKQEKEHFLNMKSHSARVTAEEAGWILGFSQQEIPILVAEGLLKPLGHPARNGTKYFATAELRNCVVTGNGWSRHPTPLWIIGKTKTRAKIPRRVR